MPLLLALLVSVLAQAPAAPVTEAPISYERQALGVRVRLLLVPAPGVDTEAAAVACFEELDRIEGLANLWSKESVLSRWNAAAEPGQRRVPDELASLVAQAFDFARLSGGAFDPTVAVPLRELGFYGDPPVAVPDEESAARWRECCGFARVRLRDGEHGSLWVESDLPRVELDLSGLVKGHAAERLLEVLARRGITNARLDVGTSSITAVGPGLEGEGWPVELPGASGPMRWLLRDESLSTSGQHSTTYTVGDGRRSHLFDPRTCRPVSHRTEQVAVRGSRASECDMASTAFLVMGVDETADWLAAHPEWADGHALVCWSAPVDDDPSTEPRPEIRFLGRAEPGSRR